MSYTEEAKNFSRSMFAYFYIFNIVLEEVERLVVRGFLRSIRRRGYNQKHILLVGYSKAAEQYICLLYTSKRALLLGMMLTLAVTSVGCGKKEADANITEPIYEESSEEAVVGDVVDNEEEEDLPDGKVRNELTGELIDESLANQRPIAVMVDNESIALPHYGLTQADVVYEMMNSTETVSYTHLDVNKRQE